MFLKLNTLHIYTYQLMDVSTVIVQIELLFAKSVTKKIGHKDIPDFNIDDKVIPRPISDDEWLHYPTVIPLSIRDIITNNEGVVVYVDNGNLFTDLPNDATATIWVAFKELYKPVPLSPYHLEKLIEYYLI